MIGRERATPPAALTGGVWVVSILACPLLGWLIASSIAVDWTLASWKWRSILGLAIGAGVPSVIALALWARPSSAGESSGGFLFLTALPRWSASRSSTRRSFASSAVRRS